VVGLFLQSGYALLPSQPHHRVSSRLTRNLILFVARHWIEREGYRNARLEIVGAEDGDRAGGADLAA